MARLLQQMSSQMGKNSGKPPFDPSMLKEFRRVLSISVVTDPSTLMLRKAEMRMVSTIQIVGEDRKQQREIHEYFFDWPKSN